MPEPDPDGEFLDGCELDFTEHEDDEETQALRPLFPDGEADIALDGLWKAIDPWRQ